MKQPYFAAACVLWTLSFSAASSAAPLDIKKATEPQKASYGIGLNLGKSLAQGGLSDLDLPTLLLGIEDALANKPSALSDEELEQAFNAMQKEAQTKLAKLGEESLAAGKKFLEENGKRKGVVTTASGLQYEVLKKAEGAKPGTNDVVSVHYEGKLVDGKVFDSSIARGQPLELPLNGVIKGWSEGLQLMKVGEKYRLYIPGNLAYGEHSPSGDIPPNAVLVFDVELLGIKEQQNP